MVGEVSLARCMGRRQQRRPVCPLPCVSNQLSNPASVSANRASRSRALALNAALPHLRGPDGLPRHDQGGHHRRLLHGGGWHARARVPRGLRRQGCQPGEARTHACTPPRVLGRLGPFPRWALSPAVTARACWPAAVLAAEALTLKQRAPGRPDRRPVCCAGPRKSPSRPARTWAASPPRCFEALPRLPRRVESSPTCHAAGVGHGELHARAVDAQRGAHPGPHRPPRRACSGGAGRRPEPQAHCLWRCAFRAAALREGSSLSSLTACCKAVVCARLGGALRLSPLRCVALCRRGQHMQPAAEHQLARLRPGEFCG